LLDALVRGDLQAGPGRDLGGERAAEAPSRSAAALLPAQSVRPVRPAAVTPSSEVRKSRRSTPDTGDVDMGGLREFRRKEGIRNSGQAKAGEGEFTQEEMSASHAATCQQQRVRQLTIKLTIRLMSRMFPVIEGPCQHSEFLN
jgi:hypothetical protein